MNETYNLKEMLEADSVNFKNIMGVGNLKMRVFQTRHVTKDTFGST